MTDRQQTDDRACLYYKLTNKPQVSEKGSDQKQPRKGGDIIFPIISQWGLSVAMETRVLIPSAPKPYATSSHPNDATHKI